MTSRTRIAGTAMLLLLLNLTACGVLIADETIASNLKLTEGLDPQAVEASVQKAIPPLQRGASVSATERKCFTCHNQAVPVIALTEIAKRGFDVDQEIMKRQLQHTWDHLHSGKDAYAAASGQGGQVVTAGYALWTLEAGGWKPDETTAAVSHYLIEYQKEQTRWSASSQRLPSMGSPFTATYVAIRGLSHFGSDDQAERIQTRREAVSKWVIESEPSNLEDHVFQLRLLAWLNAGQQVIDKNVEALLAKQSHDGGWSQTSELASDAYATSTALISLQDAGRLPRNHPAVIAGCRYLIKNQQDDGTWHVVSHAKPIQTYYESGFPHGKDQFISITATAWAALALAPTLPEKTSATNVE